jgi:hypothetical protein
VFFLFIRPLDFSPQIFQFASVALGGEDAFFDGFGRFGFEPRFWFPGRPPDQFHQPLEGILPVAFLGSEPPGGDMQNPLLGDSAAGYPHQPHTHFGRQGRRSLDVKTQVYCRGHFVDILAARPRCPNKIHLDFVFVEFYFWTYIDHLSFHPSAEKAPLQVMDT